MKWIVQVIVEVFSARKSHFLKPLSYSKPGQTVRNFSRSTMATGEISDFPTSVLQPRWFWNLKFQGFKPISQNISWSVRDFRISSSIENKNCGGRLSIESFIYVTHWFLGLSLEPLSSLWSTLSMMEEEPSLPFLILVFFSTSFQGVMTIYFLSATFILGKRNNYSWKLESLLFLLIQASTLLLGACRWPLTVSLNSLSVSMLVGMAMLTCRKKWSLRMERLKVYSEAQPIEKW